MLVYLTLGDESQVLGIKRWCLGIGIVVTTQYKDIYAKIFDIGFILLSSILIQTVKVYQLWNNLGGSDSL